MSIPIPKWGHSKEINPTKPNQKPSRANTKSCTSIWGSYQYHPDSNILG